MENAKPKREDLQIWCSDCLIIIECKGSKNAILRDSELGKVLKYVNYRKSKVGSELVVYGLTIVNHDNQKPFYSRNKNSIDTHKNDYAVAGSYGIITTVELVAGFLMMKNNEITFEDFKSSLKKSGIIKFSAVQKKSDN